MKAASPRDSLIQLLHNLGVKMVFESLVADLINKYLGDFVENLDRSQLKIGIWGGMFSVSASTTHE